MRHKSKFDVWRDNFVLCAKVSGQWNASVAKHYAVDLRETARTFNSEPWAHIVFLDNWGLGSPEIEPIIAELLGWVIENKVSGLAMVFEHDPLKRYQLEAMLVQPENGPEIRYFDKAVDAIKWIKDLGFTFAPRSDDERYKFLYS